MSFLLAVIFLSSSVLPSNPNPENTQCHIFMTIKQIQATYSHFLIQPMNRFKLQHTHHVLFSKRQASKKTPNVKGMHKKCTKETQFVIGAMLNELNQPEQVCHVRCSWCVIAFSQRSVRHFRLKARPTNSFQWGATGVTLLPSHPLHSHALSIILSSPHSSSHIALISLSSIFSSYSPLKGTVHPVIRNPYLYS